MALPDIGIDSPAPNTPHAAVPINIRRLKLLPLVCMLGVRRAVYTGEKRDGERGKTGRTGRAGEERGNYGAHEVTEICHTLRPCPETSSTLPSPVAAGSRCKTISRVWRSAATSGLWGFAT